MLNAASSLAWKTSLRKSQDAVALQQIKERVFYLWLIVVISVRQSTVAAISGSHCRALVMAVLSTRLTAWLQNSKKGGTVREIDAWAESPRLSPLWLSASSSACHGLLIITVDNAITYKAQRDKKCQRTEAGERGNYRHADASAWCCCAWCKIHEGVSWC